MSSEGTLSCVEPVAGPMRSPAPERALSEGEPSVREEANMVLVGREAPDFEARAFVEGDFKTVKLSDYRGQWVVVCFYPGDFTFV